MFNMPSLSATDNELTAMSIKPLTDIAKTKIVIPFMILPNEAKTENYSAPGADSGLRISSH